MFPGEGINHCLQVANEPSDPLVRLSHRHRSRLFLWGWANTNITRTPTRLVHWATRGLFGSNSRQSWSRSNLPQSVVVARNPQNCSRSTAVIARTCWRCHDGWECTSGKWSATWAQPVHDCDTRLRQKHN